MKWLFFILFLFTYQVAFTQVGVVNNKVRNNSYAGAEVYQIPIKKSGVEGSVFYENDWLLGNVFLKNGSTISNRPVKYNILDQQVVFKEGQKTMSIKLNYADSFNILTPNGHYLTFMVNNTWTINGIPVSGVYQKLTNFKKYGLVKEFNIYLVKANYNVALSAGERNDHYVINEALFLLDNTKGELTKVPKRKKQLINYFDNSKVDSYIKKNKVHLVEEDLIKLIEFANQSN